MALFWTTAAGKEALNVDLANEVMVDRGSAAVTSQRRALSGEVAPHLPTRDHNALDVPQSQVATVGRLAGNDAMNTVNNVTDAVKGALKSDIPPENPNKPGEASGP
jgi:hypothetical protein